MPPVSARVTEDCRLGTWLAVLFPAVVICPPGLLGTPVVMPGRTPGRGTGGDPKECCIPDFGAAGFGAADDIGFAADVDFAGFGGADLVLCAKITPKQKNVGSRTNLLDRRMISTPKPRRQKSSKHRDEMKQASRMWNQAGISADPNCDPYQERRTRTCFIQAF